MDEYKLSVWLIEVKTSKYGPKIIKSIDGPIYQNEVAKKLGVEAGTIQGLIKKFLNLGILEPLNSIGGIDVRRNYFKLSKEGKIVKKKLEEENQE